jgi:iron complex outermembrane receptor protein
MRNIDLLTYGVEMSWRSDTWRECLSGFGNLSYKYVRRKELSSRKRYMRQPPFIANAGVSFARRAWEINLMGKYVSQYRTDRFLKEEVNIGNYFNFDANVTYSVPRAHLQLYGALQNVFDVRYATVSPIYPDFGRQMSVGIRLLL